MTPVSEIQVESTSPAPAGLPSVVPADELPAKLFVDGDAAQQAAMLGALPAQVALLDAKGVIVSVNDAWRRFGTPKLNIGPGHAAGLNYLRLCDDVDANEVPEAGRIAGGIRAVLSRRLKCFSIEYPCHSRSKQRWFLFTATPLPKSNARGAVIMHLDVSAKRQDEEKVRASESRLRQMAENIRDVLFLIDAQTKRMLYVSSAYAEIWGRTCESLYVDPESWTEALHPEDRAATYDLYKQGQVAGSYEYEYRIVRPDGSTRYIEARGFPVCDDTGAIVRIAGVAEDVSERKEAARDLRESERRFSDLLANVQLVSMMLDREGRIIYCNDYLLQLSGWSRDEIMGRDWAELFIPPEIIGPKDVFQALLAGDPTARHYESEILARGGERRLIRWNNSVLRSGAGEVIGTASIGEDITERKRSETRIKLLNRVHAVLSHINTLIVRVSDRDELFSAACRIAVDDGHFQMAWIGVVDRQTAGLVPIASAGVDDSLWTAFKSVFSQSKAIADGQTIAERVVAGKRAIVMNDSRIDPGPQFGKVYRDRGIHSLAVLPLIVENESVGMLALYAKERDFFQEEELKLLNELAGDIAFAIDHIGKQERLDYLAYYDAITGLANRNLFVERVTQQIRNARSGSYKLALYLIDLERFKNINDTFGQAGGDALLKQMADWLTLTMEDVTLVARVGADQFAVVLPEVRHEEAVARLLEKTTEALMHQSFEIGGSTLRVAAKIGVALFPDDGTSAETLFSRAEAALKKAKASGDRYLFYTQQMTEAVARRLTLEHHLRGALDKNEFVLHYQPKVSLATGLITSAEALIRWNDPRTGLVAPSSFIQTLEETGLIYEVGRWALRQGMADCALWRAAGLASVGVAVNVSALQLRNRGFLVEIKQAIEAYAPAPVGVELEITESMIMGDVAQSIATLRAIRDMGVRISIDDFGTGFSSLSYLSKLPIDSLKIDRSFVADMTLAPGGLALVSTVISLAHALKLTVVAEGVETDEQSRLLRLLSCDEMQGYLFSRPVPVGDLITMLEHQLARESATHQS
jgi:diguanylate cyclase (GGDEF)-like protein/PAS domain S-box-containing protein